MGRSLPKIFVRWLLDLSQPLIAIDEKRNEVILCHPALDEEAGSTLSRFGGMALIGQGEEARRRTCLALGAIGSDAGDSLWLVVPVEPDDPEDYFLVLFYLGTVGPDLGSAKDRLDDAFAEREMRHIVNQPLTAVTFLLENLYFASLSENPGPAYLLRKRGQMLDQIAQLRTHMITCRALPGDDTSRERSADS